VPQPGGLIVAARDEPVALGRKGYGSDKVLVSLEHSDRFARGHLPEGGALVQPVKGALLDDEEPTAACGQPFAVARQGHSIDGVLVPDKAADFPAGCRLPQSRDAILAPSDQPFAIDRQSHGSDPVGVSLLNRQGAFPQGWDGRAGLL